MIGEKFSVADDNPRNLTKLLLSNHKQKSRLTVGFFVRHSSEIITSSVRRLLQQVQAQEQQLWRLQLSCQQRL